MMVEIARHVDCFMTKLYWWLRIDHGSSSLVSDRFYLSFGDTILGLGVWWRWFIPTA
jgi:hypothetical protein